MNRKTAVALGLMLFALISPTAQAADTFYTLTTNSTAVLAFKGQPSGTASMLLDGQPMGRDGSGNFSATLALKPGFNSFALRALDANGLPLLETNRYFIRQISLLKVGGNLPAVTVWGGDGGILQVTNNLVVPRGGLLRLLPGTVVLLNTNVSIYATNATIDVAGTNGLPALFLPSDQSKTWGEILVTGTNGVLNFIHGESVGGHIEVLTGATGTFRHSNVRAYVVGTTPLVHTLQAKQITVQHSHFADYYETLWQESPILIEDSHFESFLNDNSDGIDFDGAPPGSAIRRCTIHHGTLSNTDAIDLGSDSHGVIVEDCVLYDTFDKGISIGEGSTGIIVRNCLIHHTGIGIEVKDSCTADIGQTTIADCTLGFRLRMKYTTHGGHITNSFNNILWGNGTTLLILDDSTMVGDHSIFQGTNFPGTGNLTADPLFQNAARLDYHLKPGSPALTAGRDGGPLGVIFPVGSSLVDTDLDGVPDSYEWAHNFDVLDPKDGAADIDGDGVSTAFEYASGTDPRDPASIFKLRASLAPDGFRLGFTAAPGKGYVIEEATSLLLGDWKLISQIPASPTGDVRLVTIPSDGKGGHFYRVRIPAE